MMEAMWRDWIWILMLCDLNIIKQHFHDHFAVNHAKMDKQNFNWKVTLAVGFAQTVLCTNIYLTSFIVKTVL